MRLQKYVFALLFPILSGKLLLAQCLMVAGSFQQQLLDANNIIEGKVVDQQAFIGADGNIYTSNSIDVYRIFKGSSEVSVNVITEGGVFGDLMQVVTPSAQMHLGDYGLLVLQDDVQRAMTSMATAFYSIDERTGSVYGLSEFHEREMLYEAVARATGSNSIQMLRLPENTLNAEAGGNRNAPSITSISPMEVTAGTQTVVTITGEGFGEQQGNGFVAFRNADDGGQSFVGLHSGPHYLNWSDTEIQLYVPSATLYNTTVAGTGNIKVVANSGESTESGQHLTVDYAKSEVIYSNELNNTVLVGMQNGGYRFHASQQLVNMAGLDMVSNSVMKWACNTGVNFTLDEELVSLANWNHDGINLIGISNPGQLPSYLLGKTITTFSGCGTPSGIQWNLIEIDVLLNRDINWWTGQEQPMSGNFDMETAILHELGHAHLLQHNNDESSPMFFQLTPGTMRRTLYSPSIDGGSFVSAQSAQAGSTCSEELHQYFDNSQCDLSIVNGVEETESELISVFPNPFEDVFTISGDWEQVTSYSVLDATGRAVRSGVFNQSSLSIDGADFPSGFYVIVVGEGSERQAVRLLKN